jgi:hypothetical protein
LPRLGVREVKNLRVPAPPVETAGLAEAWESAEEQRAEAAAELRSLRKEVRERTGSLAPELPDDHPCAFQPAVHFDEAWLPKRVVLRAWQSRLPRDQWARLGSLVTSDRRRLRGENVEQGRMLRLSDAEGDLTFDLPADEPFRVPTFRIYAEPLRADEVLLSLLGSASKAVFNHPAPGERVWVSDHWARLRPHVHPGALALALLTDEVRWQLDLSATGAVQQFITHDDVAAIMVPLYDDAVAHRLHRRVCGALEQMAGARSRQKSILDRVNRLIDQRIGEPR